MKTKLIKFPIGAIIAFIWIGFICSISFMEAWLKFRAALVTLPVGLSIGRLIFGALNKVEWVFAIIIGLSLLLNKKKSSLVYFFIPVLLLLVQTFVLLPELNERVETILQGGEVLPSALHYYYISMELIKVICLYIFGISILNRLNHTFCEH